MFGVLPSPLSLAHSWLITIIRWVMCSQPAGQQSRCISRSSRSSDYVKLHPFVDAVCQLATDDKDTTDGSGGKSKRYNSDSVMVIARTTRNHLENVNSFIVSAEMFCAARNMLVVCFSWFEMPLCSTFFFWFFLNESVPCSRSISSFQIHEASLSRVAINIKKHCSLRRHLWHCPISDACL